MPDTTGVAWSFAASGDFDVAVGSTETTGVRWSFGGAATFTVSSPPVGRRRRVVVTDVHGATFGEFENARLGAITYDLNKPETWSFQVLQNDPKASLILDVPFREVQVWRGDQILAWGPAVRPAMSKDYFVVNCHGAMWHLGRRNIGKADRTNWVVNGSFEDGLTGWDLKYDLVGAFLGTGQTVPPDAQIVSFPTVLGTRALREENFVSGHGGWIGQDFLFAVDDAVSPDGDTWTLKGYVFVEEFPEGGGNFENRGLYLERFSTTQLNPDAAVQAILGGNEPLSLQHVFVSLDEDTPKGVWIRQEIEFTQPPKSGEPEIINVRLHGPNGVVYWDAISLTLVEKLGFYGVDQALIAKAIVEHLQDPAYDKSDVNIATSCPLTGILRTRVYVHSEHPPGQAALDEFPSLDDGFDFSVAYTPTTRTFTTHYPHKGTAKTQFALSLGTPAAPGNISDFTYSFDGETAASSVIVLGSGTGSDREEGFAVDASVFSEGLTLEQVYVSPPETNIDSLDNMAAERLMVAKAPVSLEVSTIPGHLWATDPIGLLWPGDSVPVTIQRHALNINAVVYRVVRLTINPNDSLNLTLNLRTDL